MRGEVDPQQALFSYVSPEARVPATHPLRAIKAKADDVLATLERTFDKMDSSTGRPSIPPERLLKSELLIALFSIRGHRLFCEELTDNRLYRWFLDRSLDDPGFDHSTFSQYSERLLRHEVAQRFFDAVVTAARREGLLSDEHFTVDGTLIEAWASLKSVNPKAAPAATLPPDDPGNPTVAFQGERRTNATHQSTTDPEARLARKEGPRQGSHALFLRPCRDGESARPVRGGADRAGHGDGRTGDGAGQAAPPSPRGIRPRTLGADKGYHGTDFVRQLRRRHIRPHLAQVAGRRTPGLDGRTTRTAGYALSQRIRQRVEASFGGCKTLGGLRSTRFRGLARTQHAASLVGAAYHLLRISKLRAAAPVT